MNVEWWTKSRLDRAEPRRADESWIAGLWEHPLAQVVRLTEDGELVTDAEHKTLPLSAPVGAYDSQLHLLVGLVNETPIFSAFDAEEEPSVTLRALSPSLDETMRDVATAAVALHNWHHTAPFCGVCGGLSEVRAGGHMRVCTQCGRDRFPRTDPAMIAAVLDSDDRILLSRPHTWIPRRMSLVAGFVEAGECLEQAVVREVSEEVGLHVRDVTYVASQAWPVPRSLMVGFYAFADDTDFCVDGEEIEMAAWFSRSEMDDALSAGTLALPGESSIAHRIITAWRQGRLT